MLATKPQRLVISLLTDTNTRSQAHTHCQQSGSGDMEAANVSVEVRAINHMIKHTSFMVFEQGEHCLHTRTHTHTHSHTHRVCEIESMEAKGRPCNTLIEYVTRSHETSHTHGQQRNKHQKRGFSLINLYFLPPVALLSKLGKL